MLKAVVKKMVRQDHWLFLGWSKDRFGFASAIVGFIKMLFNQGIGRVPNPLNGGTVFIRPGTTDQDVYDEIFFGKEYDLDLGNPHFIVDAGAHIGLMLAKRRVLRTNISKLDFSGSSATMVAFGYLHAK